MMTDSQTNFYQRFDKVLANNNIEFVLLPQTKDVWAVDYMPIQSELDKFVRFVYNPSYLQTKKLFRTISDVDLICNEIGVNTFKTDKGE